MHADAVVVQYGQSLIDVAVQHGGSLDTIYAILQLNRNILTGLTDAIVPGTLLSIPRKQSPHTPRRQGNTVAESNTLQLARQAALWQRLPSAQGNLIQNEREPASAYDEPSPADANYYIGDDHVYHRVDGRWKRTPLINF